MPTEKVWDISRNGVDSIRALMTILQNSLDEMDSAFTSLNNTFVCSIDGLGIYSDSIHTTLKTMKAVNEESTKTVGNLMKHLDQYANHIEKELAKKGE